MSFLATLIEYFFDCYWIIYKLHIPPNFHCLDDGKEFVDSLTIIGKFLHWLRPLMIRRKKHKILQPVAPTCKTCKIRKDLNDYHFDPSNTRLYYSLISDFVHQVAQNEPPHVGTQSGLMMTNIYNDNTTISSFLNDKKNLTDWSIGKQISYLFTFDSCSFPQFNKINLTPEISETLSVKNAGGSSELSEVVSMYCMHLKFGAYNFIPEMNIHYCSPTKICDYLMDINQEKFGVSVTRAIMYPFKNTISMDFATSLLYKKLIGIIVAKKYVAQIHTFNSSVVHIWCNSGDDATVIQQAYQSIIDKDIYGLYSNIYIACTVCNSDFIYTNLV